MKLSEAILLGDSLKRPNPTIFLHPLGHCGCALGGAVLAIGIRGYISHPTFSPEFMAAFPWFTFAISAEIGRRYYQVVAGEMTIEQLADYVRSIEPAEEQAQISEQTTSQETVHA